MDNITDEAKATNALLSLNGKLDALLPSIREQLQHEDITKVAGDLTVVLAAAGPYTSLGMAITAILRLADQ